VDLNGSRASLNVESQRLPPGYWCCCRPNHSQARYTSSASITRPEATARSTAILCHVTISSFTVTFTHTAISAHPTSETMNVATLMRINNLFTVYPPRKATRLRIFGTLSADPDPEGSTRHVRFRAVPEETLEDVRRRILASLEKVESTRPARRGRGASSERIRRNHRLALGVVDLLDGIARELGSGRVRAFADEDTPGGTPLVLQPRNPDAAGLKVLVDWFDDTVHLYPGDRGRVEIFRGRRQLPESFLPHVATYVNAVVSGGFRATYSTKTPRWEAKLEFLIDGTWRRAGALMTRGVRSHKAITRQFEPY
jgi:hypothetical protein